MKDMNLNHDAPDIPTAFKLTKKRANGIDTFTRLSFQAESDRKVSEVFSGAIKTGVVKNQNEIAFMGICVGVMLELRIQQVLKEKALREAQKQSVADKHIDELRYSMMDKDKPSAARRPKILTAKK